MKQTLNRLGSSWPNKPVKVIRIIKSQEETNGGSHLRFKHLGRHDGSNSWNKLEGIGTG